MKLGGCGELVMDDQLRKRILEMSTQLVAEEKEKLDAAGTFVDIERLTVEIGDEPTRQLTNLARSSRSNEATLQPVHACPNCGTESPIEEMEPLILKGMRGEIEYFKPKCHCLHCRRSFFPGREETSTSSS
jgi:Zn finger protein HypA/HybF involved in hydrogenase expression